MTQFKMKCKTSTAGLPYEYDFEMASVDMARDYTKRHVGKWSQVPWFMSMELWQRVPARASDVSDVEYEWHPISEYTLLKRDFDVTEVYLDRNGNPL